MSGLKAVGTTESWGEFASDGSMWHYLCTVTGWQCCLLQMMLEMYLIVVKEKQNKKGGHWNYAETLSPGSRRPTKSQAKPSPLLFQYTMRLIYRKETDETTYVSKMTACTPHACAKHSLHKHTRLKIDFHSWLFHFVGKVPGKISAARWLVKVIFKMTVGIVLTRKAGGLAKNRVRVCAQELMLAFPQHCIVSREGGSTIVSWELTLSSPIRFHSRQTILRVKSGP